MSVLHICWFNFDALAQGNAYKPTKEPINYRGPGGDRTHDLQTEATPPAASCPARTLHATEIAPKNATPMTCPWLHWTTDNLSGMHMVSISTPVCVNFELRPGAGDIHICWFNFDALAQGNAYKPTKEPINYRGPGGDRTHDLQTEATPPAASCPARTLHATEIAPKNATPMTCPWLHWTTDNLSGMQHTHIQYVMIKLVWGPRSCKVSKRFEKHLWVIVQILPDRMTNSSLRQMHGSRLVLEVYYYSQPRYHRLLPGSLYVEFKFF